MDMKTYISGIPGGGIILWHGAIVDIPIGFVLCNGANSTPDLRNRFIVGAADTYAPGDTGGSASHAHTYSDGGHTHTIGTGGAISSAAPEDFAAATESTTVAGTTAAFSTLPTYYAICYIMKT